MLEFLVLQPLEEKFWEFYELQLLEVHELQLTLIHEIFMNLNG